MELSKPNTPQMLFAPNGKPSNLSPEDWTYVRTDEFKAWFGDWENDPGNASKVLDENGEPLLVYHGSNQDFDKFDVSKCGAMTGSGEWVNNKTGEKTEIDANKGIFFSSYEPQAVSYALLAEYYDFAKIRSAFEGLCPCFNSHTNYQFKTREDFISALETVEPFCPSAAAMIQIIQSSPERKILTDIIPNLSEDQRNTLIDETSEGRRRFRDICSLMQHGHLSNMYNNYFMQEDAIRNIKENIERLRQNDATVKNTFGTYETHTEDIMAGGNDYVMISFRDDRCVFIDEATTYLDECSDEDIKGILGKIDDYHLKFLNNVNDTLSQNLYDKNAIVYKCFLNIRSPFSHDYEGSAFPDRYKKTKYETGYIAARQVSKALRDGNDGVIYQDIRDPFNSNTFGVFSPEQIMIVKKEHDIKFKVTVMKKDDIVQMDQASLRDLIIKDFTGAEVLTRAAFWRATQSYSEADLAALKGDVKTAALETFALMRDSMAGASPEQIEKQRARDENSVKKMVNFFFRPWTRLAGRIENDIEQKISAEGVNAVNESYFAALCESYASREEYRPYLEKEFKGFVGNRCKELYLDYTKMPESLKCQEILDGILDRHPYILESNEWNLLNMSYNLGEKNFSMTLQEAPSIQSNYIGGEVKWSRYLPINGPVLPEGRITGFAHIDYKDCTNSYFIINGNEKVVNFHAVPVMVRRKVLEEVYMLNRYGSQQMTVAKNHQMTVSEQPYKKPKGDDLSHRERLIEKSKTGFDKMLSSLSSKPNETQKQVSQTKK